MLQQQRQQSGEQRKLVGKNLPKKQKFLEVYCILKEHQKNMNSVKWFSCSLCLTLCNSMDCSAPGFPVLHHLPELAQTHVHQVGDAIQSSHPFSCLQSFPASRSFPMSQFFASGGQSIGASASALVLSMNIQD